jgi:hypothetical protein
MKRTLLPAVRASPLLHFLKVLDPGFSARKRTWGPELVKYFENLVILGLLA